MISRVFLGLDFFNFLGQIAHFFGFSCNMSLFASFFISLWRPLMASHSRLVTQLLFLPRKMTKSHLTCDSPISPIAIIMMHEFTIMLGVSVTYIHTRAQSPLPFAPLYPLLPEGRGGHFGGPFRLSSG